MSTQDKAAPEIDYLKLVEDAFSRHKYRTGTPTCIAFKRGAEWLQEQFASTQQAEPPRRLSPYDAVAEAMRLASLMGGSIGMSDVEKTRAYESRLRSHLIEFIYPLESATAKAAIEQRSHELLREWIAKGAELHSKVKPRPEEPAQAAGPAGWAAILIPTEWTPGGNAFKQWCAEWFGPDSDDDHLMRAVRALLATAQPKEQAAPAQAPLTNTDIVRLWGSRSDGPSNGEIISFARQLAAAWGVKLEGGE